ncbi:hypothetical protein [Brasilonema sennae]|uniref:hypothetical protein n=1 Tax=Brasilonema sennae TaxID=1397703 RepID=UPI00155A3028|nr:hypothetical protein [Brasilonema sennae]
MANATPYGESSAAGGSPSCATSVRRAAPCGGSPKVCRGKQPKRRALTVVATGCRVPKARFRGKLPPKSCRPVVGGTPSRRVECGVRRRAFPEGYRVCPKRTPGGRTPDASVGKTPHPSPKGRRNHANKSAEPPNGVAPLQQHWSDQIKPDSHIYHS